MPLGGQGSRESERLREIHGEAEPEGIMKMDGITW